MIENIFPAMQSMETRFIWAGIIWAVVMGLAAGNYACSLIHRLPRGRLLLDKAPYCGSCGTLLQVRDLFPVFSAMLLRHRCRYCGTSFPISHTVTEILLASIFVLAFLRYGFGDMFILVCFLASFLIILAAIEVNEKLIMGKVMIMVIVTGMLTRMDIDEGLFGFVLGGLFGAIIGAVIWRKSITKEGHIYRLPKQAELMAMAGICVGSAAFPKFLLLLVGAYIVTWVIAKVAQKNFAITIPFGIAIMVQFFVV
ncbi:MAG: prepilin peptidase [Rickettsiales bacterium]